MTPFDYFVLIGTMVGIAAYGTWKTRHRGTLQHYLKGDQTSRWFTIGISVMATQASSITFMSTPGQGYESGMAFVQNYFGMPVALIVIAMVFIPIYRKMNVYTAYEYLGNRFDKKTRLLTAFLFLLQRGLAAGISIYAPAIVLSTIFGWNLQLTIVATGLLVTVYTVTGGSEAVNLTQKFQMAVIFSGMVAALVILITKLPGVSLNEAFTVAGGFQKLKTIDFSTDPNQRYTFWSGIFGAVFLSMSYFGTDQSQVQRYIHGESERESRLGLMFNAVMKIPMQFFILLLGVLVFVVYQFERPPVFFNQVAWKAQEAKGAAADMRAIEDRYGAAHTEKQTAIREWLAASRTGDVAVADKAKAEAIDAGNRAEAVRTEAKALLKKTDARASTNDSDYVFITYILTHLPHGLIGLLIAVFFAAALSSKASELNALGSTTIIDFYRYLSDGKHNDAHYVSASKWFTAMWGLLAIVFALSTTAAENLIQWINILGSLFYGTILGIFLVAFFLKWIRGTAVFWGAAMAEVLVCYLYSLIYTGQLKVAYLWLNPVGVIATFLFATVIQLMVGPTPENKNVSGSRL